MPQVGLDILAVGYPFSEQQAPELMENEKRINVNAVTTFRLILVLFVLCGGLGRG